ncbi:hypothetical protein AYO20_08408 [Fonsecaea nubica]|uniref:Uncharacterized protein n=1 Tax=Fonsecaea nubica TaxID=856822 RepID=A0A178CNK8_9EURO|nr:hypothetical protein AYO20_08408 [Fonsecaea nubica]OAL31077.1 hypothetical protein AYO20_08408 [Fonsecaea nubica]
MASSISPATDLSSNDEPVVDIPFWGKAVTVATYRSGPERTRMVDFYISMSDKKLRTRIWDKDLTSILSKHLFEPPLEGGVSLEEPSEPLNSLELACMVSLLQNQPPTGVKYPGLKELVDRLADMELKRLHDLKDPPHEMISTRYFLNVLQGFGRGELSGIGRRVFQDNSQNVSKWVDTVPGKTTRVKTRAANSALGVVLDVDYCYWYKNEVHHDSEASVTFHGQNDHVCFQNPKNGRECGAVSKLKATWKDEWMPDSGKQDSGKQE